jgi:hypothetical protein
MHDDAMNERDELDSQLDAALATYTDAEAEPGLAYRILAATSRRQSRRPALRWLAVAVPALAAAVLVATLLLHRAGLPSETPHFAAQAPSAAPRVVLPAKPARPNPSVARWAVKARDSHVAPSPLPRREVFPTPSPLTAEEQALLKLGNRRLEEVPAQEVPAQTVQSATQGPVEPIHIAAIHIPPLNPPDNGSN